jgi:hypothetical protein
MSFIEVAGAIESYRYGPGDPIYYNIPNKRLNERLRLLSSEMVERHIGHGLVELYLVSFSGVDVDVDARRE